MQTVYLDTALLLRILDGNIPAAVINQLHERADLFWVFSPALYDDLVAAQPGRVADLERLLSVWPRRRWIVGGNAIPSIELDRLLSPAPEPRPGIELHLSMDGVVGAHPDYFDTYDARGQHIDVQPIFRERAEQKVQSATATTYSKEAAARSRKPDRELNVEFKAFVEGEAPASPRVEQELSATQEKAQAALSELESAPGGWIERVAQQQGALLGVDAAQLKEMMGWLPEYLRAFSEGDLGAIRRLQEVAEERAAKAMAIVNPLGLKPGSAKWAHYPLFLTWLPEGTRTRLLANHEKLKAGFERWLNAADECPGGMVLREIGWQMHLDHGTPAQPSDQTDLMHVAVLPYVDVFFADKRVKTYLDRTAVPDWIKARCRANSEFEGWATKTPCR